MRKGKGFDRLRLAAVVATAAGSLFAGARSARAGGATLSQGGAEWFIQNSGSGPGTAPFLTPPCMAGERFTREKEPQGQGPGIGAPQGTGTGCAFNITSASTAAQSDAYDGFFLMAVNGTQYRDPDGVFTTTATSVSGGPTTIAGLTVSGVFTAFSTAPVIRAVYTYVNPTAAPITVTVAMGYNVGSDSSTIVQATSDGDQLVETTDAWQVSSEGNPSGDPVVTLSRFGAGGAIGVSSSTVVLATAPAEEDQIDNYQLTIPANSTRSLMFFSRLDPTIAAGVAAAPTFASLATVQAAGFTAGLSAQQLAEIANWSPAGPTGGGTSFFANVPTLGDWGKYLMVLALGGIAFVATRRLRNPR